MRTTAAAIALVTVFALGGVGGYVLHGQGAISVLGSGTVSCGTWLSDRKEDRDLAIINTAWVHGYLTGAQDFDEEGEPLSKTQVRDLPGREAWLDNYCRANPLKSG